MKGFSRLTTVGFVISVVGGLVIFKMAQIQNSVSGQNILDNADRNYEYRLERVLPERGNIYDRYGFLLAGNKVVYELGLDLTDVENPESIAREISSLTGMEYGEVYNLASTPYVKGESEHVVITDWVEVDRIKELEKLKLAYEKDPNSKKRVTDTSTPSLEGLTWSPHFQRQYPENTLASNVLGFITLDRNTGGIAQFGVEAKYDHLLAGTPLDVKIPVEPRKIVEVPSVPPGANLFLTIDRKIQDAVEKTLDRYVKQDGAVSGTIIVMDPKTGEILAMAVSPRANPNKYWEFYEKDKTNDKSKATSDDKHYNAAVDYPYEPGSVYKTLTMGAALDAGVVKPDTSFLDTGVIEVGGVEVQNWDRNAWGPQTMVTCMQHSLNVCLTWVALQLKAPRFYEYMQAFGIDKRTNIDLADERTWPLSLPGDNIWSEASLATNSFGQGVMATPIQMITAISAFANDGKMMVPHVLRRVMDNGTVTDINPRVAGTPVSAKTAKTLTEMLSYSLQEEASTALVDGYKVAGKTGTAEIADGANGYTLSVTNASFVGWGPVDDPRFIVYVWLEKPTNSPWGSIVAAPLFRAVVEEIVVLMDLPPDEVRQQLK